MGHAYGWMGGGLFPSMLFVCITFLQIIEKMSASGRKFRDFNSP